MSEPTKLTPEQIAAIRARLEAATPGPWGREGDPVTCNEVSNVRGIKLYGKYRAVRCRDDAAFIAAAPADIAALLSHVAALDAELAAAREENARLRKAAAKFSAAHGYYSGAEDTINAEVDPAEWADFDAAFGLDKEAE